MAKVEWSPRALGDLAGIAEYIATDSPKYAWKTVQRLRARVRLLAHQPFLGRVVPGIGDENLREVFMSSYRIIYEITDTKIGIVHVRHFARDLTPEDLGR